ncbi:GNAT family N-acetyltransferase [Longispora albida]|uniref:GNAT family N-acetyltransferase n=1 Tax=Longispora albida TaxID=203523 RepID=UPI00058DE141|nr:GNAT family N-acetyltransferase [Longispora albida]
MQSIDIHSLTSAGIPEMAQAFAVLGWPGKTATHYEQYLEAQAAGTRAVLVASVEGAFAGYVTVLWNSGYVPFRDAGIPEISDLNVLPHFRRRHVATALMDEAEALIATRSSVAGLGVGLYPDYGPAQLMYVRRGYEPDGRGVAYGFVTADPGAMVRVDDDLNLMMTRVLPRGEAAT